MGDEIRRLWNQFNLWLACQDGRAGRCALCRRLTANYFISRDPNGVMRRECLECIALDHPGGGPPAAGR